MSKWLQRKTISITRTMKLRHGTKRTMRINSTGMDMKMVLEMDTVKDTLLQQTITIFMATSLGLIIAGTVLTTHLSTNIIVVTIILFGQDLEAMDMVTTATHTMVGAGIMITVIGDGTIHIQHQYLCIMTITELRNIDEALIYIGKDQEVPVYMAVQEITELDLVVAQIHGQEDQVSQDRGGLIPEPVCEQQTAHPDEEVPWVKVLELDQEDRLQVKVAQVQVKAEAEGVDLLQGEAMEAAKAAEVAKPGSPDPDQEIITRHLVLLLSEI